jgi:uncharacterized protein YukE
MSRPTGWDVVGYWGDPVPGDVWEIRALARKYTKIGEAAEDAQQRLKSVKGSGWLTAWDADSGDVFIDKIESMPGDLEACADSYIELGSTLQTWADDVDDAQYTADKALAEAKDAKEDEATAASSLSGAQSTYNTYNNQVIAAEKLRDKYPDGEGAPSGTKVLTDYQFKALKNNRTVASNRVNELSGDISDASSRVEAAKKLVQEAHGDWTERETATVTAIGKSADAGLGEQSFWDKIFGSEVWETIITVCKIVVAIGGIIVMIIGGPLAWIVLAAALLVLADTLYKMSKGQADGWDLAFALLDCIPGAKGLTTAAGLIGGAAALIKGGKGLLAGGVKLAMKGAASIALKNVQTGLKAAKTSFDSIAKSAGSAKNALANMFKGGDAAAGIKKSTIAQNSATGKAFEDTHFKTFQNKYNNAETQVTIKVVTPEGKTVKVRVDAIGFDDNGSVVIREFKSSETAALTKNQKPGFPGLFDNGGLVVGKGRGKFPGGFVIPPVEVLVIRPGNLGKI